MPGWWNWPYRPETQLQSLVLHVNLSVKHGVSKLRSASEDAARALTWDGQSLASLDSEDSIPRIWHNADVKENPMSGSPRNAVSNDLNRLRKFRGFVYGQINSAVSGGMDAAFELA
jgi:hypothetical protein